MSPPSAVPVAPRLRRARLAVFGVFTVNGFLLALWLVNIPAVQAKAGISHAVLGGVILLFGLGSFAAMQITGQLIDRAGSRFATILGIVLMLLSVNLPGMATGAVSLGLALFVFGLGNGATDVAMNHQAVVVERRYGRPIMSTFHAFFSLGGAVGALVGAATQKLDLGLQQTLLIAAVLTAIPAAVALPGLLPLREEAPESLEPEQVRPDAAGPDAAGPETAGPDRTVLRRVLALSLLAFLLMLSEGVANDWSALHAVEHLDSSDAAASLAYGTFAITMTVGRLLADRVSHAIGAASVVRYGSALGAVALLLVISSPAYPVTLLGWALFGIGVSGIVPQIFSAAGNVGGSRSGVNLSRVVGAGYLGLLAGPAIIGWLGGLTSLNLAFVVPLSFCVVGVVLAGNVAPGRAAEPAVIMQ